MLEKINLSRYLNLLYHNTRALNLFLVIYELQHGETTTAVCITKRSSKLKCNVL